MTIKEAIIDTIDTNFKHTRMKRNADDMRNIFNSKIGDSETIRILPPIQRLELATIDDLHDKLSLFYDDVTIDGVVTWKPSVKEDYFVLMSVA